MNNEDYVLNMGSQVFESLRHDFDDVLKKTLANMTSKDSKEATLTVKLAITLADSTAPNFEGAGNMRDIIKPSFSHKVSSVLQIKTEESGSLKGEYELVYDDDLQDFVMKPIDYGQESFDKYAMQAEDLDVPDTLPTIASLPSGEE